MAEGIKQTLDLRAAAPVAADPAAARGRVRAYLQATEDHYIRRDVLAALTNGDGRFELRRSDLEALVGSWTPATPTTDTTSREG